MPGILPISDLKNHAMETHEQQAALIDLYEKLAVAEQEVAAGAQGEDFLTVAKKLRQSI